MRTRRTLPTLLAATLAVGALAFAPTPTEESSNEALIELGGETPEEEPEEPELYGPCTNTFGTAITPDAGFDAVVPTPVGAANFTEPLDAALLQVSLEGHEVGTRARVSVTLDWDTPGGVGDYDLNINGANDFSVDQPERETLTVGHCGGLDVKTEVFIGLPVDTLTLTADVTPLAPVG